MRRPKIPFFQERFGAVRRLFEQLLEIQANMIGTARFQIQFRQFQIVQFFSLTRFEIFRIFQPYVAGPLKFGTLFLFLPSDFIDRLIDDFHYMELVESQVRMGKVSFHAADETRGHVAADLLYRFRLAAMLDQVRFKRLDGPGVLSFGSQQYPWGCPCPRTR